MRRTLRADVEWLGEPYDFGDGLVHVSVYLIENGGRYVLVDSGSHYHEEAIVDQLRSATEGGLEAVVVSHADLPHAGNVSSLSDALGEFDVVCATAAPELVGVPDPVGCNPGDRIDVAGRSFSFIDAPLADITDTVWAFDHESGTLFTADGFGSYHSEGESTYTSADFRDGIPADRIYEYHREMFRWLEYVDPERLVSAIEELFDAYDVRCIAPTHGPPIVGPDVPEYVRRFTATLVDVVESYE